jgi:ABC-2 type transport system permease protein
VTAQLRSELLKQRSTRASAALAAWMVGLVVFVVLLHALSFGADELARQDNQRRIMGLGPGLGTLFAALLGAMSITGEFRHGTIRPTLLATPNRGLVVAAKVAVSMLGGLVVGVTACALTVVVEVIGLSARGIDVRLTTGDVGQVLAGGALAAALLAAVGVGAGAAIRNQVPAVVGICVWLLLVEPLLLGDVPAAGRFAPGAAAGSIAGAIQTQVSDDLLAPAIGVLVLALYALLVAALGALVLTRRDVD